MFSFDVKQNPVESIEENFYNKLVLKYSGTLFQYLIFIYNYVYTHRLNLPQILIFPVMLKFKACLSWKINL